MSRRIIPSSTMPDSRPNLAPRNDSTNSSVPIHVMQERWERGENIWTGKPLQGRDADDWLLIQDGLGETEVDSEEFGDELAEMMLIIDLCHPAA